MLGGLLFAAGCVDTEAGEAAAILEVSTTQLDCCYDEGSWGILEVAADGKTTAPPAIHAALSASGQFSAISLVPGGYSVTMAQVDCFMGCSNPTGAREFALENPEMRLFACDLDVEVDAGETLKVNFQWSPFDGCVSVTPSSSIG